MYNITNLSVSEYLDKLAAPIFPGPAVGSAAATAAAMAAALLEMSYEITIKKDEEQQENLRKCKKEIKDIRQQCLFLATEDMKAYAEVIKVTRKKEDYPYEYETAMKKATDTLIGVIQNCEPILTGIKQFVPSCYVKVLGDLAGSAYLAEAAAGIAKEGIEVNLKGISDEVYKKEVSKLAHDSCKMISEIKDKILQLCKS